MAKENFDYEFECINGVDYKLIFQTKTTHRMLCHIFNSTKTRLIRKKGIKVDGEVDNITKFDIQPIYFKLLKTTLKKQIEDVKQQVLADGIRIVDYYVDSAYFEKKDSTYWNIFITFVGNYEDKR